MVKLLNKRGVDVAIISFVASLTFGLVSMVAIIAAIFDLLENIKNSLDKSGIEIPYPQLSLHLNKEKNFAS